MCDPPKKMYNQCNLLQTYVYMFFGVFATLTSTLGPPRAVLRVHICVILFKCGVVVKSDIGVKLRS
uniref:Uncharacterized protein n=1 Tax=Anguilla anguilla TaxID=7936 RepID=A0A0E9WZQ1_ANGAN